MEEVGSDIETEVEKMVGGEMWMPGELDFLEDWLMRSCCRSRDVIWRGFLAEINEGPCFKLVSTTPPQRRRSAMACQLLQAWSETGIIFFAKCTKRSRPSRRYAGMFS